MTTKTLDLGCGSSPKNPFNAEIAYGVDLKPNLESNVHAADLAMVSIPFVNEEFNYVTAFDFIEHIPRVVYGPERRNSFVELMNEIYRVLQVGGIFLSDTPAYPHQAAFVDPTHVNIITEGTFPLYFADGHPQSPWAVIYGFKGKFKLLSQEWRGPHLTTIMQKLET